MNELEKVLRVMKKVDASVPHAVLLVLDATVGQNALSQVEIFQKTGVTGLVMTKLDGTAHSGSRGAGREVPTFAFHQRRRERPKTWRRSQRVAPWNTVTLRC